jgi:TonB family protein
VADRQALPEQASLAVVGLDPARSMDFALPRAPRQAGFSAGPEPRPEGGVGSGTGIVVPGLLAQGAPAEAQRPVLSAGVRPSYRQSIAEAARIPATAAPSEPSPAPARTVPAPDPLLEGRVVYVVAIQMPNVTSSSGSWLVWFAERTAAPRSAATQPAVVAAPVPVRKVDPKYVAAAAAERVEGKVRLAGVIRKDGRVDSIVLLRHVDVRLDRSAADALSRWEFQPATRAGVPIDVDAVFEIPFRLAPVPKR